MKEKIVVVTGASGALGKVVVAADAVTLAADVGLRKHYLGF